MWCLRQAIQSDCFGCHDGQADAGGPGFARARVIERTPLHHVKEMVIVAALEDGICNVAR